MALNGLRKLIDKISSMVIVDKKAVDEAIKELQRILLSSDVDVELVFKLSEDIRNKAFGKLPTGMTRKEFVVKLLYDEITGILGGTRPKVNLDKQEILLAGLFGSGKTSTAAKLANFYKKRGLKPYLIPCDVHRPAAFDQLKQLAEQVGVDFYDVRGSDAVKILKDASKNFDKYDVIIVDTAGRSALDRKLIEEIKQLKDIMKPDETYLIIPADIGQSAKKQALEFKKALDISGVIVTKTDSTAKAGGALAACNETKATIKFITVGERINDIEIYDPQRFVSRLLGFGDLQTLLEKAKENVDEKKAKKIVSGDFTIEDFISQIKSVNKMGPIESILDMMGLKGVKIPKNKLKAQEEKIKKWEHIVNSMTKEEKKDPSIINYSRIKRISKGCGVEEKDVKEFIKNFLQTKKMIKKVKPGTLKRGFNIPGFGKFKLR